MRRRSFLAVVQAPVPTVTSNGTPLRVLADWFAKQPGISPHLAAEVRAIGDPAQTLPIPIRFDRQTATRVDVDGVSASRSAMRPGLDRPSCGRNTAPSTPWAERCGRAKFSRSPTHCISGIGCAEPCGRPLRSAGLLAMPDDAIVARGLAKRYGRVVALHDLTLRVGPGECLGFLGPNGAGKSTALKMLLGLVRPTAGEATLLGRPVGERCAREGVGYLPELFRYPDWQSAREVLGFHARLIRLERAARAIDMVLDEVGLSERAADRVATYSKGMQQRLGLAVALLGEPRIVFLDEPTSALDPLGRSDVRALIERLRARKTTVFLNSHLLGEVERMCDRVCVIDGGRVVAEDTVAGLTGEELRGVRVRTDDGWREHDVARAEIPALIARLVAQGARIHAVEPNRTSLEERFLTLVRPA